MPILKSKAQRSWRAGLTLVEVLLAMLIIGAGGLVLMTAASRCLAVIRVSRNYHSARHVFDLGELEHPVIITNDTIYNLDLDPVEYPNGFTFSRKAEDREDLKGMKIVRTRVAWSQRGQQAYEETVSYLYYTNDLE